MADKYTTVVEILTDSARKALDGLRKSTEAATAGMRKVSAGAVKAQAALRRVGESAKAAGKQMTDFANKMKWVSAGASAFAGTALKLYADQERAESQLAAALRASGQEVTKNLTAFKEFASALQAVTTVGDETTLGLAAMATQMGLSAGAAKRAVYEAIGLSKALGISEETAIRMTAALAQGDATLLRRYIPALRGVKDPAEAVAKAHDILGSMFSAATAEAQTAAGQMAQLKNAAGDLMEQLGALVAEAILPAVRWLRGMVEALMRAPKWVKWAAVGFTALVAAIAPLAAVLGAATTAFGVIAGAVAAITAPVWLAIGAVVALVAAFVKFEAVRKVVGGFVKFAIKGFAQLARAVGWVAGLFDKKFAAAARVAASAIEGFAERTEKAIVELDIVGAIRRQMAEVSKLAGGASVDLKLLAPPIDDAAGKASKLADGLSGAAKAAKLVGDELRNLPAKAIQISASITPAAAPATAPTTGSGVSALTAAAEWAGQKLREFGSGLSAVWQTVGGGVQSLFGQLGGLFGGLSSAVGTLFNIMMQSAPAQKFLAYIANVIGQVLARVAPALDALFSALAPIVDVLGNILAPIFEILAVILRPLAPLFAVVGAALARLFEALKPLIYLIAIVLYPVFWVLGKIIEGIMWVIQKVIEGIVWLLRQIGIKIDVAFNKFDELFGMESTSYESFTPASATGAGGRPAGTAIYGDTLIAFEDRGRVYYKRKYTL